MIQRKKDYHALMCDDCGIEIFVDSNMVMLDHDLWKEVSKGKIEDAYCDDCIEKRLGRSIVPNDFLKAPNNPWGTALCNMMWIKYKQGQQGLL